MALSQNYSRFTSPRGFKLSQTRIKKDARVKANNSKTSNFVILLDKDMRVCKDCIRVKKFNIFFKGKLAQPVNEVYNHLFGCRYRD